jgi:DNA-binding CsgD family transcriptional regulator
LLWVAQGKGNQDIAVILGLSPATVKKHTMHIFDKLGVETRAAAMLRALESLAGGSW